MSHPLVSPVTAGDWTGAPPLFLACGEERNSDCALWIASLAYEQCVAVQLEVYESMTHLWHVAVPGLAQAGRVVRRLAEFCVQAVRVATDVAVAGERVDGEDAGQGEDVGYMRGPGMPSHAHFITFEAVEAEEFSLSYCTTPTRKEVMKKVTRGQEARRVIGGKEGAKI